MEIKEIVKELEYYNEELPKEAYMINWGTKKCQKIWRCRI